MRSHGSCYFQLRRYEKAIPWYEKAIAGFRGADKTRNWLVGGSTKSQTEMLALCLNDLGAALQKIEPDGHRSRAVALYREALSLDPQFELARNNLSTVMVRPGAGRKVYLNEQEELKWSASRASLAAKMVRSLARASASAVLLLPVDGETVIVFPGKTVIPLTWQAGSPEAQREYFEELHQHQDIPVVQDFLEAAFVNAGVPVLERDPRQMAVLFDERDFAAVFASPGRLMEVGQLANADAICSIKYDFFYECTLEYEDGLPVGPVNHYRYRIAAKCVDVRDGVILFSGSEDTSAIQGQGHSGIAVQDPDYLIALAAIAPEIYKQLPEPSFITPEVLCARVIVASYPSFAADLRDCEYARQTLEKAMGWPTAAEPEWALEACMSYAICIGDTEAQRAGLEDLLNLTVTWAQWWRDALKKFWRVNTQLHDP